MFSVGEQLYRLTARDEETLLVEPFFRRFSFTIVGAAQAGLVVVPIPIDRCIYIKKLRFTGASYVAARTWSDWLVELDARFVGGLITVAASGNGNFSELLSTGVGTGGGANAVVEQSVDVDTIFPPGMQTIRFNAFTPPKAVDAFFTFEISAYFLPPGRFGRR